MTSPKDIRSRLDALMATPKAELEERTREKEPLPLPSEVNQEEALVHTLFMAQEAAEAITSNESAKDQDTNEHSSVAWWQQLFRPWVLGPVLAAGCVCLVLADGLFSEHQLDCKGTKTCTPTLQKKYASLHLGVWSPRTRSIQRVTPRATYAPTQNISFGFTIRFHPSYLYLYIQKSDGQLEQLYSPKERGGKPWKVGFSNLIHNKQTQYYSLKKERGRVSFVLLATRHPLPKKDLSALDRGPASEFVERVKRLQKKMASEESLFYERQTITVGK